MKKTIHLLFALILLVATSATAQKKFSEGTIIYEISSDAEEGMMAQMMPKAITMKIKNDWVRTEVESSMMSNITLYNGAEKKMTNMMDIMGNKYAIEMTEKEIEEQMKKAPAVDVQLSNETKEIAGYKCKKATIINKDTKSESTLYYTESITNFNAGGITASIPGLSQIKGLPLEYTMSMQGIEMKVKVKSITFEKVDDELFKVLPDYKKTTMEELQKEIMGDMGGR